MMIKLELRRAIVAYDAAYIQVGRKRSCGYCLRHCCGSLHIVEDALVQFTSSKCFM